MHSFRIYTTLFSFLILTVTAKAQLTVNANQTASVLATKLAGPGITISSPVLTCANVANGTFVATSTPLTVDSGILLTSGQAIGAAGPETILASTNLGTPGDASLTTLAMATTHDACVLEFDFVPKGDTIRFNYQFGSEEYTNSVCGQYNDAFAFFISGPGITGAQNMALVPGTNIPVTVNSINNGVPGSPGYPAYCNIGNCTSMGPGAPFTAYYYDNTGGLQLTYKGFTKKLVAVHDVIPCNTYHLKIAVADASNSLYDSGVFIEAGSLKANSFHFDLSDSIGATVNGIPHTIVKGCAAANVTISSTNNLGAAQTVHFSYGGTATQGVDFSAPDSATIAAGTDSVVVNVAGLVTPAAGIKTTEMYLLSPTCGIVDSIKLTFIDTPTAYILTPDTIVCPGMPFTIRTTGTPGLLYSWAPATTLSSSTVMQPVATPLTTTTYTMTANMPAGAGCPAIVRSMTATTASIGVSILTPDTSVCLGASVPITVSGNPSYTYSWLPSAGLNNASLEDPTATPGATTTYTLTATSASGCTAQASITITVAPADAMILTADTVICPGASVTIRVSSSTGLIYSWSPPAGLDNAGIMQPTATPSVTTTYYMSATVPGSVCRANGKVTINVETIGTNAGPDQTLCTGTAISLKATPGDGNYNYAWNGPAGFASPDKDPLIDNAQAINSGVYSLTVTDNVTGCASTDTMSVAVTLPSALTNVTPGQTISYGSTIQLNADNALYYRWIPNDGSLSNANINNPLAAPLSKTTYVVYGMDANGCMDSASVTIDVVTDTFFIPSAFTPNGDGLNDVFRIGHLGYFRLVEMSVFNRWGNLVYHVTDGNNRGWDGTFNGIPQDTGVFSYLAVIASPDGRQMTCKGDVTLLR